MSAKADALNSTRKGNVEKLGVKSAKVVSVTMKVMKAKVQHLIGMMNVHKAMKASTEGGEAQS